ncbi:MAG: hypothetical protein ACR2P7_01205, partial [bacterium]
MPAQDSIVDRLTDGAVVVTATARLARELRRAFDQRQLAAGCAAWESANALPYDALVRRLWSDLGVAAPGQALLDRAQLAAAWERIIRDDIGARNEAPLWNSRASANLAARTWRMAHDWRINLDHCAKSSHDDHRSWLRWARRYQQKCAEHDWIDPHRACDLLCAALTDSSDAAQRLPHRIAFAGFDRLLPQQQALLDALRQCGVEAEHLAPEGERATIASRECDDEAAQWLAAAHWARAHLQRDANARIAIVAPNLDQVADAIDYALRQVLCPRQLTAPTTSADLPYHLSLGAQLARYPPAQAALVALAPMSGAPLSLEMVERLVRSPFLRSADSEATARARLAQRLRRRLPYQIRFARLLRELIGDVGDANDGASDNANDGVSDDASANADSSIACPQLVAALRRAAELLHGIEKKHPAGHWARRFDQWLTQLGWPGERALDSDEFQVARAVRRQLRELARLDLTAAPMTAAGALSALRRQLDEQVFQVEARAQPVQVLGIAEAAGQRFDALWFGGLVEADWPPPQRVNPFIAPDLQRAAGVTEASLETSREHARAQQRRLLASADEAVLSRARVRDEVETEPSPLLGDCGDLVRDDDETIAFETPIQIVHESRIELERFDDQRAPALARGAARGGTSVITDQAKCPFRAFAIHRLGACEVESREPGLTPIERGKLIHYALQLAWQKIESSHRLESLEPDQLDVILRDAAADAGTRYRFLSGYDAAGFQQVQEEWVRDTLREWFAAEQQRAQSFEVQAMEQERELALEGLELAFKIDRIDCMADGALALIDYKT